MGWATQNWCCLYGADIAKPNKAWVEGKGDESPITQTNGDRKWRCYSKQATVKASLDSAPTIHVRIPKWASQSTTSIEVNDQDVVKPGDAMTGSFLGVKRHFVVGDVIKASFGMRPRFERINDDRSE